MFDDCRALRVLATMPFHSTTSASNSCTISISTFIICDLMALCPVCRNWISAKASMRQSRRPQIGQSNVWLSENCQIISGARSRRSTRDFTLVSRIPILLSGPWLKIRFNSHSTPAVPALFYQGATLVDEYNLMFSEDACFHTMVICVHAHAGENAFCLPYTLKY